MGIGQSVIDLEVEIRPATCPAGSSSEEGIKSNLYGCLKYLTLNSLSTKPAHVAPVFFEVLIRYFLDGGSGF